MRLLTLLTLALSAGALLPAKVIEAQDTLHLSSLQAAAVHHDPRMRQLALQDSATALRLRTISAERLPTLRIGALSSYQSEVASLPIRLPGVDVPEPPKDRHEVALELEQRVYDGGVLARRRDAEVAQLRIERARIAAALHPLRSEVNQAFFRAALLQSRAGELRSLMADLEARLAVLRAQVRAGAALPSDTAEVRAEVLRALQAAGEVAAQRRAALAQVEALTGVRAGPEVTLVVPELAEAIERATRDEYQRLHPRHLVYDAQREQLRTQTAIVDARLRPQLSAFGQLGYGKPGLKQFTDEFHEYWIAGVRLRWQPWTWGSSRREREVLRIQAALLDADEAAFAQQLHRQTLGDTENIAQLQAALALDEQILVLREQVERRARVQLEERVITPAIYVDARTNLQDARLARERHRTELALARAQLLTTLGIDLP